MVTSKGFTFNESVILKEGPFDTDMDLADEIVKVMGDKLVAIGMFDPKTAITAAITVGIQTALWNVNNPPDLADEGQASEAPEGPDYALAA